MQETTTEGAGVPVPEDIGSGIGYPMLSVECPAAAADFIRTAAAVTERLEFDGETGVTDSPFRDWTFHYVGADRWVARLAAYRDPLYLEWNGHIGRWDDERVHDSMEFIRQEETHPLRIRARGTIPREPA